MDLFEFWRIYVNLSSEFTITHPVDLDEILVLYAKSCVRKDSSLNLFSEDGQLCLGRTNKHLVDATNRFICGMDIVPSDESMGSYTSKRQLKFLKYALLNKKKRKKISGYSMILLHCVYTEIRDDITRSECSELIKKLAIAIYELVSEYYSIRPDDEVARFLLESYRPLLKELNEAIILPSECFPDIPKNIRDQFEE